MSEALWGPEAEWWWWWVDGAAGAEPVGQIEARDSGAHMRPVVGRQVGSLWVGRL